MKKSCKECIHYYICGPKIKYFEHKKCYEEVTKEWKEFSEKLNKQWQEENNLTNFK